MKFVLIAVAAFVALAAVVVMVGAMLPRHHEVSRSAVLNAPPADVYRTITDFASAPAWRRGVTRVEILGRENGRLRFREHGKHDAVTYEVTREEPPRLLVTEIVDRNLGYSGSWSYAIAGEGNGTRLTITERGDVSNVIFRFMSRFVFGHTKTIDTYLASLEAHLRRQPPEGSPRT